MPALTALLVSCADARLRETPEATDVSAQGLDEREDSAGSIGDATWLRNVPRWRAYLDGKDYYLDKGHKTYFPGVEGGGSIVLVRESDLDSPERWFWLHLGESQQRGAGYIQTLIHQQDLAPADLIGILFALERAGEEPPLITTLTQPQRTQDSFEGGGARVLPPLPGFPGWDEDHRGGPVCSKPRAPPHGSGVTLPAVPRVVPFNPADPSTHRPRARAEAERKRAAEQGRLFANGVLPRDPPPVPSPLDEGYMPSPGEERETFKCEGSIYYGYKGACVDFQAMPRAKKWVVKLGAFLEERSDIIHDWVFHHLWHDGRNPECMDSCELFGSMTCAGFTTGVIALCGGVTGGACVSGILGAAVSGGLSGYAFDVCKRMVLSRCRQDICTR